jgi:hypothetical protein
MYEPLGCVRCILCVAFDTLCPIARKRLIAIVLRLRIVQHESWSMGNM